MLLALLVFLPAAVWAEEVPFPPSELAFTTDRLTPDQAAALDFRSMGTSSMNLGPLMGHLWVRLRLDADDLDAHGRWLSLHWSYFQDIRFYLADAAAPGGWQLLEAPGQGGPAVALPREPGRLLPEFSGQRDVLVHARADGPAAVVLALDTPQAAQGRSLIRHTLFGIYLGAMLGMAAYSLFLMVAVRERTYLGYAAFLVSTVFYVGLLHNTLTPWLPKVILGVPPAGRAQLAVILMVLAAVWFVRRFLRAPRDDRALDRRLLAIMAVAVLAVPLSLLWPGRASFVLISGTGVVAIGLIIWASIRAIRRGFGPARYLLSGWTLFSVAVLLHLGLLTGLLPYSDWLLAVLPIGSLGEALLLAFALGDRVRHTQMEEAMVARERDRYRTLSDQDGLTGLFNRRALDRDLKSAIVTARESRAPLSLIELDADHFKDFNDHYGHLAGDDILRCLARVMGGNVRRGDKCFRYGGEEFVIILPGQTVEQARKVAERIREAFRGNSAKADRPPCTVSMGVAGWREGGSAETLLARADAALYAAKEGGRNRVELAG
ncbi:MAG: diguanylate cyclase [Pseudomonadota bacterium]